VSITDVISRDAGSIPELIALHAAAQPTHPALFAGEDQLDFAGLDDLMNRVAAAAARDGIGPGGAVAIVATTSIAYVAAYLGLVRAGASVAPLQPSATPDQLAAMIDDAGASHVLLDEAAGRTLASASRPIRAARVALDDSAAGQAFTAWLAPSGTMPRPVALDPNAPFNLIYSSGTTGTPKGIVQSHRMRWAHVRRAHVFGYGTHATTLVSTPLYSNTTLVSLLPSLALGGAAVLLSRFDAGAFLRLAARHRVTHAMLVPVQYERILRHEDFDRTDLSSFRMKFCTSAPFAESLKAEVLRRWPGGLVEYFGMTEGGGTCILVAHEHPTKLHTVGRPADGHDIRVIDDQGREVTPGEVGEVVGHSPLAMMTGYHGLPDATTAAEWHDSNGKRFIRTGDLGRFDREGFLTLVGRKKDIIISGGFNIYPVDLEAALLAHPDVVEAAVVGVPSVRWGETPVAFVVVAPGRPREPGEADEPREAGEPDGPGELAGPGETRSIADSEALRAFANAQLGSTQRITDLVIVDALPRSTIGKVLKRELRDTYTGPARG
jgi:long-chain acyl-CoA synthetase